jgi:hypothetical protein
VSLLALHTPLLLVVVAQGVYPKPQPELTVTTQCSQQSLPQAEAAELLEARPALTLLHLRVEAVVEQQAIQ